VPDSAMVVEATPDSAGARVTAPTGSDSAPDVPAVGRVDAPTAAPTDTDPTAPVPADTVFLTTPLLRLGFTSSGALVSARLLEYETFNDSAAEGARVELAPPSGDGLLRPQLRLGDRVVSMPLQPATLPDSAGAQRVSFTYGDNGRQAVLTYAIEPDSYLLQARLQTSGFAQTPQLLLGLPSTLRVNEADPDEDRRALAYVVNGPREGIESVRLRSVEEERSHNGPFTWVAVKNKYFLVAAIAGESGLQFGGVRAQPRPEEDAADLVATLPAAAGGAFAFDLYVGPQEADRLAALGNGLEDVNPYGWRLLRPILRPISHLITWALVGLHNTLDMGYGWVLIIFGVLVRIVLWPLNAKSMRSQLKNMELQPRIKEIQEKYKGSPEIMQKEMMKLYKEGFNPLGGCLPMLIPFPVLIALFYVFQGTIEFRGVEFLWLPDLSRFDPLYVLPVLLGATMFLQQWITSKSTPAHMANPQMKMMMYFMPVFMTVIFLRFASGLNLYYVAQNVASIPQQVQLMRERKAWHANKR
ncbi:MAG: membrane protein insertase YidC, partial [Longimicrobiales bacterium]